MCVCVCVFGGFTRAKHLQIKNTCIFLSAYWSSTSSAKQHSEARIYNNKHGYRDETKQMIQWRSEARKQEIRTMMSPTIDTDSQAPI